MDRPILDILDYFSGYMGGWYMGQTVWPAPMGYSLVKISFCGINLCAISCCICSASASKESARDVKDVRTNQARKKAGENYVQHSKSVFLDTSGCIDRRNYYPLPVLILMNCLAISCGASQADRFPNKPQLRGIKPKELKMGVLAKSPEKSAHILIHPNGEYANQGVGFA